MAEKHSNRVRQVSHAASSALGRIEVLSLFPLLTLLAMWTGIGDLVFASAFLLPTLLAIASFANRSIPAPLARTTMAEVTAAEAGLVGRDALLAMLDRVASDTAHETACILIQIDDWEKQIDRWGADASDEIALRVAERLCTALRREDLVARLGDCRFGIVLRPIASARIGMRDAIVGRLRAAILEPIAIGGASVSLTVCVGHTKLLRDGTDPARSTLEAAETALVEAHRNGPDAVRAYSPGILKRRKDRAALADEVEAALVNGQIQPWFQPQINTGTGVICGFEALARWHHPDRGILAPAEFLGAVEDAGRMENLGHGILFHALTALQFWDKEGLRVPSVSVNFSATELRNPRLADRVKWEVDRFDLRPGRLTIEILETVAAESEDDAVLTTIAALRDHGFNLDLDDFGIGQASLAAVRRFGVNRIKIDRSFVLGMDQDPEQQAMVAAVLSMAQHLGVETLAEGVETASVQNVLAHMGCDHLQGYHIARPMPFNETVAWATQHNAGLAHLPISGRKAG